MSLEKFSTWTSRVSCFTRSMYPPALIEWEPVISVTELLFQVSFMFEIFLKKALGVLNEQYNLQHRLAKLSQRLFQQIMYDFGQRILPLALDLMENDIGTTRVRDIATIYTYLKTSPNLDHIILNISKFCVITLGILNRKL